MKKYTIKEEVMARSLENMHIVMIEARKYNSFAELRNNCDYSPELLQETRWYSMNGVKLLPLPQPPLRARTDALTNTSAQRATQLMSVLARVYAVSRQNQITNNVP
jgi:hypothetical protein